MRTAWWTLLFLLAGSLKAQAIELNWSTGTSSMSFSSAQRCTLNVRPSEGEDDLPPEWRLVWVSDSCGVSPIAIARCSSDTAQVLSTTPPQTHWDDDANLLTSSFCSGNDERSLAQYVLDLPAQGKGKLLIVAMDPADPDSEEVIESNIATFNGGVDRAFPPVVLRVRSLHESLTYEATAYGSGLDRSQAASISALDFSWQQDLQIQDQSSHRLVATADLAASVPRCVLSLTDSGVVATACISEDPPPPNLALMSQNEGCETRMREVWPNRDPYLIQPKDFAFVTGGWTSPAAGWNTAGNYLFHVFYIRHNQYLSASNTENNIGHAVSDTLAGWVIADTAAIKVRPGRFDSQHVWAPHIVRQGITYNMFYTGVDAGGNQRIGLATSRDLVHWTQQDSILEVTSSTMPWADATPDSLYQGAAQLRDPFVMVDPQSPGDYLMYFVTVASDYSPEMVVGVARSSGDLHSWSNAYPLWNTHHSWPNSLGNPPTAFAVESPHAFYRGGKWWLLSTVNQDSVWACSNTANPASATASTWDAPKKLWTLVPPLQAGNLYFWHATEYLQLSAANDIEYIAAFNDANVCLSFSQMKPAASPYLFELQCFEPTGVAPERAPDGPELSIKGMVPSRGQVAMTIEMPTEGHVLLTVFDVTGRRVRSLLNERVQTGKVGVSWDGRDSAGARVKSGLFYLNLRALGVSRTICVPVLR